MHMLVVIAFGCMLHACTQYPATPVDPPATPTPDPLPTPTMTASVTASNPLTAPPTASLTPEPTPSPTATWSIAGPGKIEMPILLYHRILPGQAATRYAVDAEIFRAQMALLREENFQTILVSQLSEAILYGTPLPPKPIVISFDDGNLDNYEIAFPIMLEYGYVGTVYIVANRLGSEGFLSVDQLLALHAAGWEIGSHSMSHADLSVLSDSQLRQEILGSRKLLESSLDLPIHSFAYPYGTMLPAVAIKVSHFGYTSAVGLGIGVQHHAGTIFYLDRLEIRGTMSMNDFRALINHGGNP
jgi:peptidoglycan/xylan/chitin deacetylase (PgdA/CDA1 family)